MSTKRDSARPFRVATLRPAPGDPAPTGEGRMGLTVLQIEVGNPASPDVREPIELLVDSGAVRT